MERIEVLWADTVVGEVMPNKARSRDGSQHWHSANERCVCVDQILCVVGCDVVASVYLLLIHTFCY